MHGMIFTVPQALDINSGYAGCSYALTKPTPSLITRANWSGTEPRPEQTEHLLCVDQEIQSRTLVPAVEHSGQI
jgi:hypothetical protein